MENFDIAEEALQTSLNSTGSAMSEHEKWIKSLEGHTKKFQAQWESLSNTILKSDFLKGLIDSGTTFMSILDTLISKIGTIPTSLGTIAGVMSFKGKGFFNFDKDLEQIQLLNVGFSDLFKKRDELVNNVSSSKSSLVNSAKNGLTNFGLNTNILGYKIGDNKVISSSDLEAIKAYNSQIDKGIESQEAFNETMANTSATAKKMVTNANGAKVSLDGMKVSANTTKLALVGMKVATIALNMALTMGIAIAIQGIITLFDKMAHSAKNAFEKSQEAFTKSSEEYEKEKQDLESLVDLIEKYKQLKSSDNQDAETRSQIANIQEQISKLVGEQAGNLDLVNGKLQTELGLLEKATAEQAKATLNSASTNYYNARQASKDAIGEDSFMWFDGYAYVGKSDKDSKKAMEVLNKSGYGGNVQKGGFFNTSIFVSDEFDNEMNKLETAEEKIEYLQGMLDSLESDNSIDTSSNALWNGISSQIDAYQLLVDAEEESSKSLVSSSIENAKSNNAKIKKYTVSSAKELEDYKNTLIKEIMNDDKLSYAIKEGAIDEDTIESSVDTYISTMDEFSNYYDAWKKKYGDEGTTTTLSTEESAKSIVKMTDSIEKNKKVLDGIEDNYSTYSKALKGLNSLSEEQLRNKDYGEFADDIKKASNDAGLSVEDFVKSCKTSNGKLSSDVNDLSKNINNKIDETMDKISSIGFSFEMDIDGESEGMTSLFDSMKESVTSTGMSTESISKMKERFSAFDTSDLFERTTNGIHMNTKALRELESEYEKDKKTKLNAQLDSLTNTYNDLTNQINSCSDAEDRASLYSQRTEILNQINNVADLASQYDGLTSAFYKWEQAQSIGEEGDMYDSLAGGLENIKQLYSDGLVGTNKFRTAVQLMSNEDLSNASIEELMNAYDVGYSKMTRYFSDSESGCLNFLNDVKSLNSEWVSLNEDGSWNIDFGMGNDQEIADALGINVESVQSVMRKLSDYGFDINLDSAYDKLTNLKTKAEEANDTLKKCLNDYDYTFNFNTEDIDTLNDDIAEAKKLFDSLSNEDGSIKVDVDNNAYDSAKLILETLATQKSELEKPMIMHVVTSEIDDEKLKSDIEDAQKIIETQEQISITATLGGDTSSLEDSLKKQIKEISKSDNQLLVDLNIDENSSGEYISDKVNEWVKNHQDELTFDTAIDLDAEAVDEQVSAIETGVTNAFNNIFDNLELKFGNKVITVDINADTTNLDNGVNEAEGKVNSLNNTQGTATINATDNASPKVDGVISKLKEYAKDWWASLKSNGNTAVQGNSRVNGTAFASGNWGTNNNGTALMGELGQELIVDPKTGTWHTVGDNGAEFSNYEKGSIIFNAEQTKQLLENGKISSGKKRGSAYASGTAFSSGGGTIKINGHTVTSSSYNGNSNSSSNSTDVKTPLEKFKDWFSTLFDWIEIKLERQTDKISKYITSAERYSDMHSYTNSANSYRSAISATATQINYQKQAQSKYNSKANDILYNAVGMGVVSQGTANSIKSKVQNGTINISEYSESVREVISSYQTWYEKSKDASDAISELHNNIRTYIKDLKDVRDAQRDLTLDNLENNKSIGGNGIAFTSTVMNDKLNYSNSLLKSQNTAYNTSVSNVASDNKKIANTGKSSISKALSTKNKTYKKALTNAKNAISNGKSIASSDLSTIKKYSISTYENLFAYNESLKNMETTRLEQAVNFSSTSAETYENIASKYSNLDDKTNDKISLYGQKIDNATSAIDKNNYLDLQAYQKDIILSNNQKEISSYKSDVDSMSSNISKTATTSLYKKMDSSTRNSVSNAVTSARTATKNGVAISSSLLSTLAKYYSKGYISQSFYESCINYNNALESMKQAEAQNEIDIETIKAEKASIAEQRVSNVKDEYERNINRNESEKSLISANQSIKTTKGAKLNSSDYMDLLSKSTSKAKLLNDEVMAIKDTMDENLSKGFWTVDSIEYQEALTDLNSINVSLIDCINEQQEYNNAIANMELTNLENALNLLESYKNYIESINSLTESQGNKLGANDYQNIIDENNKQLENMQKQANENWSKYLLALADADSAYAGKTADEWKSAYYDSMKNLNDIKKENEGLYDSIWQTYVEPFETACKKVSDYIELIKGVSSLLNENNYTDDNGKLTDVGIAQISTYLSQIEQDKIAIEQTQDAINELNKMWSDGTLGLSEDEYNEKLQSLKTSLLNYASDEKSVVNSLMSMWSDVAKAELDSLNDVIDARKEALQSKKDYYDYDKNIKAQTKDIQSLQAQISALEGIDTAEAKAQMAKLNAELSDKQDSLDDDIQEHLYNIQIDGLDELKTTLQDNYDDYVESLTKSYDKMTEVIKGSTDLVKDSYESLSEAFKECFEFLGIDSNYLNGLNGYANGSKGVSSNQIAWTQENGGEIIIRKSDGAILTPIRRGDGIIPSDLTNNLFAWGELKPDDILGQLTGNTIVPISNNNGVNVTYGSLLNVEGNVDKDALPELRDILEQSYDYTKQMIVKEARKNGLK